MENNRSTSIQILMLGLCILTCLLAACTLQQAPNNPNPDVDQVQPFEISVTEVKVISKQQQMFQNESLTQTDQFENRLLVSVLISNVTNLEFQKVWYELQLNSEADPYIASHILKFASDKMDITTREEALAAGSKDGPIWGFAYEWEILLTSEEDLHSYYDLSPEGLAEELKSITVQINWSDGTQSETLPLELGEEDVQLLK